MKKIVLLLLVGYLLLLPACGSRTTVGSVDESTDEIPTDIAVAPETFDVGTVTDTSVVNIRLLPSTDGRILDTALRGIMFRITGISEDGDWYEVFYRGDKAYISAEYLYVSTWEDGSTLILGTVLDPVNVRKSASIEAEMVCIAQKNEQFVVRDTNLESGWYEVDYKGEPAFVRAEYLSLRAVHIEDAVF